MQACDSTCAWCARHFWRWVRARVAAGEPRVGRSGEGDWNRAAATSVIPARDPRDEEAAPARGAPGSCLASDRGVE